MGYQEWDVAYLCPRFSDLDNDGKVEMVFNVNSGYSRLPRCLCVLDPQTMEIIRRFDHHLGSVSFEILDLNQDNKNEIALGSYAANNFSPDVYLSDAYSWLLLLDHQLNLLREPLQIGEKFSSVKVLTLPAQEGSFFLAIANKVNKSEIYLVDSKGVIIKNFESDIQLFSYKVNYRDDLPEIIASTKDGRIIRINHDLEMTREFNIPDGLLGNILAVEDVLRDGKTEIIFSTIKGLYIFDHDGNTPAFYPTELNLNQTQFFLIHIPTSHYPLFVLSPPHALLELRLIPNRLYARLSSTFAGLFLGFYLLLILGHLSLNKLHQYVSFFLFSLRGSDNAIILLNHSGRALSVNQKVNHFLGLETPMGRRHHFSDSLKRRPMVVNAIEECIQSGQQAQRRFSFEEAEKSFIGEITVTPFRVFLGYISAYLVEIKDSTSQVLLERQQNWQRNIRRIVHDIKTPLAGVQLKLQELYMNISEKHPGISAEILESLEAAHSELLRIRNISKDFLKFSDLEKVQTRSLDPEKFIEHCVAPFKLYANEQLKLSLNISPGLPAEVFWDERQIELLLHIIMENSLDALQGNGEIDVAIKPVSRNDYPKASFIEICIKDTGPGIFPKHQEKIFEPHFSTKKEGTGLGLAFAKHIVQQHGGTIEFVSGPSSGTVFVVTLPNTAKDPTER